MPTVDSALSLVKLLLVGEGKLLYPTRLLR